MSAISIPINSYDNQLESSIQHTSALTHSPKEYIMQLTSILENDVPTINYMSECFEKRGYVFVRLPQELVSKIDECMLLIEDFFNNNLNYKNSYFKEPIFGYFGVSHKESFRLLTGARINEHKMPTNFNKIKDLVQTIDRLMYSISMSLSTKLFRNISATSKQHKIPFFDLYKPWGMLDFAHYHNTGLREGLNCDEHYDPGLLSFHLRSSEEGLQLKNEFGKWIKVPVDKTLAVLWTGKIASEINPKLKPCVHRVTNVSGKPRLSLWHEICTEAQEHKELIKDKTQLAKSVETKTGIPILRVLPESYKKIPSKAHDYESSTGIPTSKIAGPLTKPSIYKSGSSKAHSYETSTGIPMSKSGPPREIKQNPLDLDVNKYMPYNPYVSRKNSYIYPNY